MRCYLFLELCCFSVYSFSGSRSAVANDFLFVRCLSPMFSKFWKKCLQASVISFAWVMSVLLDVLRILPIPSLYPVLCTKVTVNFFERFLLVLTFFFLYSFPAIFFILIWFNVLPSVGLFNFSVLALLLSSIISLHSPSNHLTFERFPAAYFCTRIYFFGFLYVVLFIFYMVFSRSS